jgi:hypothetical protein
MAGRFFGSAIIGNNQKRKKSTLDKSWPYFMCYFNVNLSLIVAKDSLEKCRIDKEIIRLTVEQLKKTLAAMCLKLPFREVT